MFKWSFPSLLAKAATKRPSRYPAVRVADASRRKVEMMARRALASIKDRARLREVAEAASRGRVDDVVRALRLDAELLDAKAWELVVLTLRSTLEAGAMEALGRMPRQVRLAYSFDITNPRAVDFVRGYKMNLIRGASAKTREGVRAAVEAAFRDGIPPAALARRIRPMIGLTGRDAATVERMRAKLRADGMAAADADRRAARLSDRLVRRRAINIARTETIRASSEGQRLLWEDAQAAGYVSRGARQHWIVTDDDRLCPVCEGIPDLNEEGVPLDGQFKTALGQVASPPAHPSCRCATELRDPAEADVDRQLERDVGRAA